MTFEQLESLTYLRATALEALRLVPPVAGPRRGAAVDTVVGGQVIPKGTAILNCTWTSSRLG